MVLERCYLASVMVERMVNTAISKISAMQDTFLSKTANGQSLTEDEQIPRAGNIPVHIPCHLY